MKREGVKGCCYCTVARVSLQMSLLEETKVGGKGKMRPKAERHLSL